MAVNYDGVTVEMAPAESISRCPKCNERLETIWSKRRKEFSTIKNILMCPHCEFFLGCGMKGQ